MSTDHQQYSIDNQTAAIARYAEANRLCIVRTYSDAARSGLNIEDRDALRQLIRDVEAGLADFQAVLVYDVSRWGRFQDCDESAYYEYICKRAKIKVHYCAEPFVNDGSLPSALLKAIKRMMAGEYSRELSAKVFAGKRRLIELGFRQGGTAGYGLRRLLQDVHGNPKSILAFGERKSLVTDRVVLVPGPREEVRVVKEIYARFLKERQSFVGIAKELNRRKVASEFGRPWTRSMVHTVLTNPKYIGANQFNRISKKLAGKAVRNPRELWVRRENTFKPIISAQLFRRAQEVIAERNRYVTHDEVLNSLRELLLREGKLSSAIVDRDRGPASRGRIGLRFNGLLPAYELVGHKPAHDYSFLRTDKRLELRRKEYIAALVSELEGVGAVVNGDAGTDLLTINGEFTLAFAVLRCRHTKHRGYRWRLRSAAVLADITVAARMVPANDSVLDYYVLPRLAGLAPILDLAPTNSFLIDVYRFPDLSVLKQLAYRTPLKGEV